MDANFLRNEMPEVNSYDKREKNMDSTRNASYYFVCQHLRQMRNDEATRLLGQMPDAEAAVSEAESRVTGDGAGGEVIDELGDSKVCKICSVGKRDNNDILIECSHVHCLFKFYHLDCLKPKLRDPPPPGWNCPSCLCRTCLTDERDECVLLCDGCDEGYHTYCLDPPLNQVPRGKWYCQTCQPKQKLQRGKKSSAVPKCPKSKTKAGRKTKKI